MAHGRVLEVTLISAKDLKKVTVFSKMRVYAVASIAGGGDPRMPTHRTHSDRHGGRSPVWHAPLRFTIPAGADTRALALHVLLRAERAFGADRDVGEVLVPVQDLFSAGGERRQHLSYQVRRPTSGRSRGVLHISFSLADASAIPINYAQFYAASTKIGGDPPYHHTGMPPPYHYGYGSAGVPMSAAGPAMGAGIGMGILGGAVGGMMMGDMLADLEIDAGGGMDGF